MSSTGINCIFFKQKNINKTYWFLPNNHCKIHTYPCSNVQNEEARHRVPRLPSGETGKGSPESKSTGGRGNSKKSPWYSAGDQGEGGGAGAVMYG